jgi:monoamine oxidase
VPLHNPAAARRAAAWDGLSLEAWKRDQVRSPAVRALLDAATRVVFGAEPGELSLLHFLFYLHSGGGLMRLLEIEKGAQQLRFVGGAQTLALGVAAGLADRVVLAAPVSRIEQDDLGVTVVSARGRVRARYAVIAVPPPLAARIDYHPALPAARDQLTQRAPMGSTVKCLVTYARPFWRERGFSGEAVASGGGPITVAFDNCSHDNAQPALLAFVVGRAARGWERRTPSDRQRSVLAGLARWFGPEASTPVDFVEQDWGAEPWTRGCPVGVMPPGVLTSFGTSLRQSVGRLHFAGTETATVWNGYMEGALESGERAAREVLRRL